MKRTFSALVSIGAIWSGAQAADMPLRKAAPAYTVTPVPTWTGFYVGANIGGGVPAGKGAGGVIGGGQVGYNYQFLPLFIVGVETDIQGTSLGGGTGSPGLGGPAFIASADAPADLPAFGPPLAGRGSAGVDWFGTVRGRVGTIAIHPSLLVYGTGGLAYGGNSSARAGWTAGGGVEWAFASNWSAKVEYLYVDLSKDAGFGPRQRSGQDFHVIRTGLNYRFDPLASLSKLGNF